MCPRNIHGGPDNPMIHPTDWSIHDFKEIFPVDVLEHLQKISFCGTFGDPMMNNDLIKMCEYISEVAPHMDVRVHTNGSARSIKWWQELTAALPDKHEIVFALDGLEDTQHLYRVGTNYNKIIENAQAVINAGGCAVWMFIRFEHNQHQVEEARRRAKDLGFYDFVLKNTRRFDRPEFPVIDRAGEVRYSLRQPTDSVIKFVTSKELETFKDWNRASEINCFALNDREYYIDANFTLLPCCILAAFLYTNYNEALYKNLNLHTPMVPFGQSIQENVHNIIREYGGLDKLNAKLGIKNIVNTELWQTLLQRKWEKNESACCTVMCSNDSPFIKLDDQIVNDV